MSLKTITKSPAAADPSAPSHRPQASRRALFLAWGAMILVSVLIWAATALGFATVLGIS